MMTTIDTHRIAMFLERSGLLRGHVPSMRTTFFHGDAFAAWVDAATGIAVVGSPMHAVCLGMGGDAHAGVCVGYPRAHPLIPDLLLGAIDEAGRWHWAGGAAGEVLNTHRLSALARHRLPLGRPAWPVWLTYGSCSGERAALIASRRDSFDLSEAFRRAGALRFWGDDATKHEFIRTTWAPARLVDWCLDAEEAAALRG